jgi:hypothetical protein
MIQELMSLGMLEIRFKSTNEISIHNLFIILDEAASSELISKNNAYIIQLLKIYQHMYISCVICVQTVRDHIKKLKRLIGDVFLYRDLSYNDLEQTENAVTTSHDTDVMSPLYKNLKGKHGKSIIHSLNDHIVIRDG